MRTFGQSNTDHYKIRLTFFIQVKNATFVKASIQYQGCLYNSETKHTVAMAADRL